MSLTNLSTKRQRIAELARSKRGVALSTLHHVIDLEWLKEADRLTRKDGAPGIDGMTAAEYAEISRPIFSTSWTALNPAAIKRRRSDGYTSPRAIELDLFGPSAFRLSRTRYVRGRLSWCWSLSMSRTFFLARTGSGRVALLIKPYKICVLAL